MSDWCIVAEQLRKLVAYDPLTGKLTWLERGAEWFKGTDAMGAAGQASAWNKRHAGRPALGSGCGSPYAGGKILGARVSVHRAIWALHYGEWPKGQIDHINGDPTDNRIENMRDVRSVDNMRNKKLNCRNKSGVSGVRWDKKAGSWVVQVGRHQYIGSYKTFEEAVDARKDAERRLGYHPNHGRSEAGVV